MANKDLISLLRREEQEPIKLIVPPARSLPSLVGKITQQLPLDSLSLLRFMLSDSIAARYDATPETLLSKIIPNTYNIFYNTGNKSLLDRLTQEHDKWWSQNNRKNKAEQLGYSPLDVTTIASIVERETQYGPEKSRIAGVYINRLKKGIPLQADPTVIYAIGDFSIRRVLTKYLEYDSPFNTYKYAGLPPGPIGIPSRESIDAVLNAEDHDYYYFCAKADDLGKHAFAKTLSEHNRNARAFQNWLNRQGIMR